jgi:diguanylate cyclase (GGDEF)-like protein
MWRDLKDKGHWDGEIWNRHKNGEVIAEKLTISAVPDLKGHVQQYVAVFSDITDLKNYQNELEHIARYDALTHLPNRLMLSDRLCQAMMHAQRREQCLGVVFIDLDGFKTINDTYGHDAGDQVLIAVSTRMRQALRDGDTLARNGGDEFVAVLVDLADASDALPLLDRLLVAAAEPIEFGSFFLQVSASIGISFYEGEQSKTAEALMREADVAMYQAKLAGKNQYRVFDPCDCLH